MPRPRRPRRAGRRARGSARAGTSSSCLDAGRPGGLLGRHRRRRRSDGWRAGCHGGPRPRRSAVAPRRLPRPLRPARQGLDRPLARSRWPVPYWDTDTGDGGDAHAARRPRTPASGRCSSACPASATTRCTRPSGSRGTGASSASSRSGTRPSGSGGSRRATRSRRPLDDVLHLGRFGRFGAAAGTRPCRSVGSARRTGVCEDGADPRRGAAATLTDPERSPTLWPSAATPPPPEDLVEHIVDIDVEDEMRNGVPRVLLLASSTRARCPTPATASSRCSAASSSG